jgi:hypothetical protein
MNRLVIIGNGFDLAHGLPTRYSDFIEDYMFEAMSFFFDNRKYEDDLISISFKNNTSFRDKPKFESIEQVFQFLDDRVNYIQFTYKSSFFKILKSKLTELNWVDVENEYFEELKRCKLRNEDEYDYDKIKKLNSDFKFIKEKLENYLSKVIQSDFEKNMIKFGSLFCQPILKEEVLLVKLNEDEHPENIHLLNFNYTDTIEHYYKDCNDVVPTEINYIHGELEYIDNPIIFGFGDEFDESYKEFEDKKNNMLFEHIKSFGYFKTQNYHNLIKFLESEDYQVYIIGHSCGLSDRTMLKEIFENEKCKSIKIFYYSKTPFDNDYIEKTMEISRHFEDKGLMRKKIVSFPLSKSLNHELFQK